MTCFQSMIQASAKRVKGIEPSYSAWEADVLPLNYTRESDLLLGLLFGDDWFVF